MLLVRLADSLWGSDNEEFLFRGELWDGGGGVCYVVIMGSRARAEQASLKVTRAQAGQRANRSLVSRAEETYQGHRRPGAARWNRRRRRNTSLSWVSPCESLCRSHSWRWLDCSPDRPSERVRPGQPWLPVCHKTVRITSPDEDQHQILATHCPTTWRLRHLSLGPFLGFRKPPPLSLLYLLFTPPLDIRASSLQETSTHTSADSDSWRRTSSLFPRTGRLMFLVRLSTTQFHRWALSLPTCFHSRTEQKPQPREHTGPYGFTLVTSSPLTSNESAEAQPFAAVSTTSMWPPCTVRVQKKRCARF